MEGAAADPAEKPESPKADVLNAGAAAVAAGKGKGGLAAGAEAEAVGAPKPCDACPNREAEEAGVAKL